jgi:hypothetical protein
LNSKIAAVQKRACGYRNPNNFKIAVYFHCGGLNLYISACSDPHESRMNLNYFVYLVGANLLSLASVNVPTYLPLLTLYS